MKRNVFSESAFFSVSNSLLSLLPAGLVVEQVVVNSDRVVVAVRAESIKICGVTWPALWKADRVKLVSH